MTAKVLTNQSNQTALPALGALTKGVGFMVNFIPEAQKKLSDLVRDDQLIALLDKRSPGIVDELLSLCDRYQITLEKTRDTVATVKDVYYTGQHAFRTLETALKSKLSSLEDKENENKKKLAKLELQSYFNAEKLIDWQAIDDCISRMEALEGQWSNPEEDNGLAEDLTKFIINLEGCKALAEKQLSKLRWLRWGAIALGTALVVGSVTLFVAHTIATGGANLIPEGLAIAAGVAAAGAAAGAAKEAAKYAKFGSIGIAVGVAVKEVEKFDQAIKLAQDVQTEVTGISESLKLMRSQAVEMKQALREQKFQAKEYRANFQAFLVAEMGFDAGDAELAALRFELWEDAEAVQNKLEKCQEELEKVKTFIKNSQDALEKMKEAEHACTSTRQKINEIKDNRASTGAK